MRMVTFTPITCNKVKQVAYGSLGKGISFGIVPLFKCVTVIENNSKTDYLAKPPVKSVIYYVLLKVFFFLFLQFKRNVVSNSKELSQ